MQIKIDYRENSLFQLCKDIIEKDNLKQIEVVSENLPIGDIILSLDDQELIIMERKSLSDLASSIKDGRYNEQSFRLNAHTIHNHNVIYLIEGIWNEYNRSRFHKSINQHTLMSSIISIQYYKGFSVYRTQTILESAMYIVYFADKLQREIVKKQKTPFYINHINYNINNNHTNTHNDELNHIDHIYDVKNDTVSDKPNNTTNHHHADHYSHVIKKVKKDNITIDNIGEIILSQIPNVSSQSAISIMNKFKTIKQLIHHLEKDDKCLDDIFIGTDKPRKLNKNCKSAIYKYLLQRDIEIIINQ